MQPPAAAAASSRAAFATCSCGASRPRRPDAEPLACGRGCRTGRHVFAARGRRGAPRARGARVATPRGRARRPRRRAGDGQLPLPARAPGGGDLRNPSPGRAEALHAQLAEQLAGSGAAAPAGSHPTGRRRVVQQRRSSLRSKRRARRKTLRPRRGLRAPRAGARAVGGRSGGARARRRRPGGALCLDSGTGKPDGSGTPCGRAHAASDRARRRARPPPCRAPAREPRPLPVRERQAATRSSRRSSGLSSSCRRIRLPRNARGRWRPWRAGCRSSGATTSRSRCARRRSSSRAWLARARQSSGR